MSNEHFQLTQVDALPDFHLHLVYADGQTFTIDMKPWINKSKHLLALKDPALFAQAKLGFINLSVEWIEDTLELASDNLRNYAIEQAGGIGHERIWNWLHNNQFTLEQGAKALGISRRMLIYYRDGEKPIPRHIWLACLASEALRFDSKIITDNLPFHLPMSHHQSTGITA